MLASLPSFLRDDVSSEPSREPSRELDDCRDKLDEVDVNAPLLPLDMASGLWPLSISANL